MRFIVKKRICDHGRTRTCNPQIRSLVPYSLGHMASLILVSCRSKVCQTGLQPDEYIAGHEQWNNIRILDCFMKAQHDLGWSKKVCSHKKMSSWCFLLFHLVFKLTTSNFALTLMLQGWMISVGCASSIKMKNFKLLFTKMTGLFLIWHNGLANQQKPWMKTKQEYILKFIFTKQSHIKNLNRYFHNLCWQMLLGTLIFSFQTYHLCKMSQEKVWCLYPSWKDWGNLSTLLISKIQIFWIWKSSRFPDCPSHGTTSIVWKSSSFYSSLWSFEAISIHISSGEQTW